MDLFSDITYVCFIVLKKFYLTVLNKCSPTQYIYSNIWLGKFNKIKISTDKD